jgi:putative flippase GtrA
MLKIFISKQFSKFILFGIILATFNFFLRILFSTVIDFAYAIIFSQIFSMILAFLCFKKFVFFSSKKNSRSAPRFFILNIYSLCQVWIVSMFFATHIFPLFDVTSFKYELSHFIGLSSTALTSFIGHKFWTFGED